MGETWFHSGSCEKVWRVCLPVSTLWIIRVSHWLLCKWIQRLWNSAQKKERQESYCALPWLKYGSCFWDTHPKVTLSTWASSEQFDKNDKLKSYEIWLKELQCRKHATSSCIYLTSVHMYCRPDTNLKVFSRNPFNPHKKFWHRYCYDYFFFTGKETEAQRLYYISQGHIITKLLLSIGTRN